MAKAAFSEKDGTLLDKIIYHWRTRQIKPYLKNRSLVCDLGCGRNATLLKTLEPGINRAWGFDIGVNENLASDKIQLKQVDLNGPLPLPTNCVDAVLSLAVIEHINDYKKYAAEAYRILKPGGRLIITTPRPSAKLLLECLASLNLVDRAEIEDHKRYFNETSLTTLLTRAGFSKIKYTPFQFGLNQLAVSEK